MPVTVSWADTTQRIVVITFAEPFVWEEAFDANRQIDEWLAVSEPYTGLIVDARQLRLLQGNAIGNFRRFGERRHANLGIVVLVTSNSFFRAIGGAVARLTGGGVAFAMSDTFEHAILIIQRAQAKQASNVS